MGNRQDISEDKSRPFRYAAFISYAHADETAAARLHNMLEAYRPPRPHQGKVDLLRPIFRDKAELTASHSLSDEIKAAVEGSRKLLVLCSPAAKVSHWVNEEIKLFRSLHGEDAILCALVEGTPDTSFPPALLEDGREPLAADLSGGREGFRYGVLQIAASLLGIGLDDLVRRDLRRRRRIGTSVVAGALIFSGAMGASTLSAMKARAAADANRAEAENLVEYMITDLKTKLEPVGRLDILDGVGDKVMEYYAGQTLSDMPDERIARQARAQHLLGQVALDAGRYDEAKTQIDAAYALTKEVLKRNPDDTDAIFAHAQSAFWVGEVFEEQGKINQTVPYWQEYRDLAHVLYIKDKTNFDFVMEAAWGENNLGIVERLSNDYLGASKRYKLAIELFEEALKISPGNQLATSELADTITGAEQVELSVGNFSQALNYKRLSIKILEKQVSKDQTNVLLRSKLAIKKSDLLWQFGSLISEEERKSEIFPVVREFQFLTKHDNQNTEWLSNYIWHLFHAAQLGDDQDKIALLDFAIQLEDKYLKSDASGSRAFLIEIIKAQRAVLTDAKGEASRRLSTLEKKIIAGGKTQSLFDVLLVARTYFQMGNDSKAREFATLYLQQTNKSEPENHLLKILYKAEAQLILGDCNNVALTLAVIEKKAKLTHPLFPESKKCS